ncbi:DUF3008 family protein [Erythrobacter sp. THAF29]|uniref:DUF3008 family protein n=1 Tax=Erythrobacter sp. THAF29 TaxID=2587851 RepID=UPI001268E0DC|nr:DUF3008 family protein [Erythrobacter sp. THAF29]QFT78784.1 hypothetical protein FIU90_14635 [Erythrobacter sp. THAF29]
MAKAKSKAQRRAAGTALAAKRGPADKSDLQGASAEMYESMSGEELEEMASTSREDLPKTVNDE